MKGWPSRGATWAFCLCGAVALGIARAPIGTADFFWHVAIGRDIVAARSVPAYDTYSFTAAGAPFVYVGWLGDICLYLLYKWFGPLGCVLATTAAVLVAFLATFRTCRLRTFGAAPAASLLVLTLLLSGDNWGVRPQTFAFPVAALFFAALLPSLESVGSAAGRDLPHRSVWYTLPALLVWANLHGSFPLGLVALFAAAGLELFRARKGLDPRARSFLGLSIAGAVTCCMNPRGIHVVDYFRNFGSSRAVRAIAQEWQPVPLFSSNGAILLLVGIGLLIALTRFRFARVSYTELALVALTYVASWLSLRHKIWLGLLLPVFFAGVMPSSSARDEEPTTFDRWARSITMAVVALLVLAHFPATSRERLGLTTYDDPNLPIAASTLEKRCPGTRRVFPNWVYGSYLMWAAPQWKLFADVRIDLYDDTIWSKYSELTRGVASAVDEIDHWSVDAVFINKVADTHLVRQMRERSGWETVYEDHQAFVSCRRVAMSTSRER